MRCSLVPLATLLMAGTSLSLHAQTALATTTTLAVGPASSVPFEQTVTLTATIADSNHNPVLHGSVTFYDGTLALGTAQVISNGSAGFTPGSSIFRTRSLSQTTHSLTATFNGTAADNKSTSSAQTVTITPAAGPYVSESVLTATPVSSGVWNLTANVTGLGPLGPTGNVTFNDTTTGSELGEAALGASAPGFILLGSTALPSALTQSYVDSSYCLTVIASGDFNNDGYTDLLVAQAQNSDDCGGFGALEVELGNGAGGFTAGPVYSGLAYGTVQSPFQSFVEDVNGDGNLDVVLVNIENANSVVVTFLGNGDGSFQAPLTTSVPNGSLVATADFNNDGIPDLAYFDPYGSSMEVTVLLGKGDGTFPTTASTTSISFSEGGPASPPANLVAGPLTGGGNAGVVVGWGQQVAVLAGEGNGSFQAPVLLSVGDQNSSVGTSLDEQDVFNVSLADLRNDGNVDIVAASIAMVSSPLPSGQTAYPDQISVLPGNSSGTYSSYTNVSLPSTCLLSADQLLIGDFAFTGVPDILLPVLNSNPGASCLLIGNGDATLQPPVTVSLSTGANGFIEGDFTGSGGAELAGAVPFSYYSNTLSADAYEPGLQASTTLSGVSPGGAGTQMADAVYSGDSNFSGSTSAAIPLLGGGKVGFSVQLGLVDGSLAGYLLAGYANTLTATVTAIGSSSIPTGSIQFVIDGSNSGSPVTLSGGTATSISLEWPAAGTHQVQAVYSGDSDFAPAESNNYEFEVVTQAPPAIFPANTLPTTVVSGTPFTAMLEVARSAQGPVPTGTVTASGGGANVQGTLSGTPATASLTINSSAQPLNVGSQSLKFSYSGDTNWTSNTYTPPAIRVTGTTGLTMSYRGSTTVTSGSPIAITGTLNTNQTGVAPTGTVTLLDNGTAMGTATLSGNSPFALSITANTLTQPFPAGSNVLSLNYSGDANWAASTSSTETLTVNASTSTVLTSNLPSTLLALTGAPVQITATVTLEGSSTQPTGTVQFYDETTPIGAPVTLSTGGEASYTSTTFTVGNHSVTAKYSGGSSYPTTTSLPLAFTVNNPPGTTSTILVTNWPPTILAGQAFTQQVSLQESPAEAGPSPTGTISVTSGGATIGSGIVPSNCTSPCSVPVKFSPLSAGTVLAVNIRYSGDTNWQASSLASTLTTVELGTPDVVNPLNCVPSQVNMGEAITCQAQMQWAWTYPVSGPTGSVELLDNGQSIASQILASQSGNNGDYRFSFEINTTSQPLSAGSQVFSLYYQGDSSWQGFTSTSTPVSVASNVPGFTLMSNLGTYSSVVQGTPVTFTATGTAVNGLLTPTGNVQFYIDGAAAGGPVTMTNGVATYTTSSLSAGSHTATASYSGNSLYSATTTNGTVVVVPQGSDTLAMTLGGPTTLPLGTPVTVSGTLTVGALGPTPTGSVALMDGATSIAATTLSGKSPFVLSFNVNTASEPLAVGSHSFSLKYAGTTQWAASASSTATVTVSQAATTTAVTSSAATANAGASVTFTATVTSTVTSPASTGTVQFYDGTTALGSALAVANGTATYTTTSLTGGTHSITAVYSGDANFATSTSPVFTENIQGITLTGTAITGTVSAGGSASYTLTVTSEGGLSESTSFACTGLPQDSTCSVSPATVTGSGSTTLTITTSGSSAAAVPNPLKLWTARGAPVLACVVLLLAPVRRRKHLLFLVLLAVVPGLTVGCGGGGGGGCVTNCGGKSTPAGTYTITVTSTTGSGTSAITATATVTLTVQ